MKMFLESVNVRSLRRDCGEIWGWAGEVNHGGVKNNTCYFLVFSRKNKKKYKNKFRKECINILINYLALNFI